MTDVFDDLAKAFKAGFDAGRSESADEIKWMRKENQELKLQYLSDQGQWIEETGRLREALRYYAKNHYPDIDAGPWGPNSNDWGDVARAALGEKE